MLERSDNKVWPWMTRITGYNALAGVPELHRPMIEAFCRAVCARTGLTAYLWNGSNHAVRQRQIWWCRGEDATYAIGTVQLYDKSGRLNNFDVDAEAERLHMMHVPESRRIAEQERAESEWQTACDKEKQFEKDDRACVDRERANYWINRHKSGRYRKYVGPMENTPVGATA